MENYAGVKLKRKDFDDVNDDFSEFSLSSPAPKMRRLDADLLPIIEEEGDMQLGYEQSVPNTTVSSGFVDQMKPPVIKELPLVPENEEKAIVLFKPMNNHLDYSQGRLSVDTKFISCFKKNMYLFTDQAFWENQINSGRTRVEDDSMQNVSNGEENSCRAVIPWAPPSALNPVIESSASQTEVSEAMDAEEMEASTMEIEDADATNVGDTIISRLNEAPQHQWFQQHCMIPQPPENTITPIVWYR